MISVSPFRKATRYFNKNTQTYYHARVCGTCACGAPVDRRVVIEQHEAHIMQPELLADRIADAQRCDHQRAA